MTIGSGSSFPGKEVLALEECHRHDIPLLGLDWRLQKKNLGRRLGNIILLQIPRARTGLLDIYRVLSECGYFGIVTPLI